MGFAGLRNKTRIGLLFGVCLLCSGRICAQAPPGPMTPSHPLPPPPKAPPAKKKPVVESRSTLAGYWKLNKDESDDPKSKIKDSRHRNEDPTSGPGGNPRVGVGYPYPGGGPGGPNGPYGGRGTGEEGDDRNGKLEEFVRPAFSQTIDLKNGEVDATNEQD